MMRDAGLMIKNESGWKKRQRAASNTVQDIFSFGVGSIQKNFMFGATLSRNSGKNLRIRMSKVSMKKFFLPRPRKS